MAEPEITPTPEEDETDLEVVAHSEDEEPSGDCGCFGGHSQEA